jgi:hypothetical protein
VLGEDEKRRQEDGFGPHGEEMAKLSKRCDQVVSSIKSPIFWREREEES